MVLFRIKNMDYFFSFFENEDFKFQPSEKENLIKEQKELSRDELIKLIDQKMEKKYNHVFWFSVQTRDNYFIVNWKYKNRISNKLLKELAKCDYEKTPRVHIDTPQMKFPTYFLSNLFTYIEDGKKINLNRLCTLLKISRIEGLGLIEKCGYDATICYQDTPF